MHFSALATRDVYNCPRCRCHAAKPVVGHWMCFPCGGPALLMVLLSCWTPRRAGGEREAGARPDFQEKETPAVTIHSALIYDSLTSWREAPFFFNVLSLFFLFRERKLLLINATEAAGRCWKLTGRHRGPRTSSIMSNFKLRAFSFSLRIRKPAGTLVLTRAGSDRLNLP